MIQIRSQKQLDELINQNDCEPLECFVRLSYGLKSDKDIQFDKDDNYEVFNYIDDSSEVVKRQNLMQSFPLGEAIKKGALYAY